MPRLSVTRMPPLEVSSDWAAETPADSMRPTALRKVSVTPSGTSTRMSAQTVAAPLDGERSMRTLVSR
ncbi:MAG: hypothetical protein K8I65_12070 [Thermoanaerobaculia bacterium]|nr:hypothetical protein [Thermoanaerobaculia bacterium]